MSRRTNRRHTRQIEQHRRNKGPEMFSKAADNELQKNADRLAEGLGRATMQRGSVAAADLLLTLAEHVRYTENPGAFERAFSMAEKWRKEPQVVELDIAPRLTAPPLARLTDGKQPEASSEADDAEASDEGEDAAVAKSGKGEILEAEFEMLPKEPASSSDAAMQNSSPAS